MEEMKEFSIEQMKEVNYVVMDKKELMTCRHKSERRWYRVLVIINILIIVGTIVGFVTELTENKAYCSELKEVTISSFNVEADSTDVEEMEAASDALETKLEELPDSIKILGVIIGLLVVLPFIVNYTYAQFRSMSVKITEKNFPEIYAIVEEYAARLGLKNVPAVYLVQGHGVLNAFASCIPFKQYIELYADLVEVAYREHHDMNTLRFIIGHEMAHIYLGHAKLHYNYSILFTNMVPVLSSTASRTREYSCDRIAQKLSGSDGVDAMMSLTAGIHLYKQVDKDEYVEHAKTVRGLFVWCYNLVSSHPITSKRVLALLSKDRSGELY